jgi:hypothetical protein
MVAQDVDQPTILSVPLALLFSVLLSAYFQAHMFDTTNTMRYVVVGDCED